MATINVKDASGATVAVQEAAAPGPAASAAAKPVVLATDHPDVPVKPGSTETIVTGASLGAGGVGYVGWLSQIAKTLAGTLTVATHAVTQSGTWNVTVNTAIAAGANVIGAVTQSGSWVLSAGTALIGLVKLSDGTNTAAVKAASTAPAAADPALVVSISPNSVSKYTYQDIAASAASTTLAVVGAGALGDYLHAIEIIPETTAPGTVTLQDGTNAAINIFVGGGTLASTIPFTYVNTCYSKQGAWKIATGANVHIRAIGLF